MSQAGVATRWRIGVDVGGTKVAAGLVNERGEIGEHGRGAMNPRGTPEEGLNAVTAVLDPVAGKAGLQPVALSPSIFTSERESGDFVIGICAPGPLDPRTGVVLNPPNVPCWRDFPLREQIERRYGVKAKVDNDGNAAALAESLWGAGRGYSTVFYGCIGTGVGTGFVQDGRIYHGRTGSAFEGGHVSIDYRGPRCNCGKKGCIEALASGTAIARRTREAISADARRGTAILALAGGNMEAIRSEMIAGAAEQGDPLAREILSDTMEYLAAWLGNMVDLLEPEVMILGGGVSEMLRPQFPEIQERMKAWCVNGRCAEIQLLPAHYGENSGIAGGAALCLGKS